MKKIHYILILFLILELIDIMFTNLGISTHGPNYEKNAFMRNLILNYGFSTVAIIKIFSSIMIIFGILFFFDKFREKRKYLIYISVLLSIIPLYGIFSSLWVLLL